MWPHVWKRLRTPAEEENRPVNCPSTSVGEARQNENNSFIKIIQTLRSSDWHSCIIFGRPCVQMSVLRQDILSFFLWFSSDTRQMLRINEAPLIPPQGFREVLGRNKCASCSRKCCVLNYSNSFLIFEVVDFQEVPVGWNEHEILEVPVTP